MYEVMQKFSRRSFLRKSAAAGSALAAGSWGLSLLEGCSYSSEWKGVSFPRVLFHNFRLFDGISGRLREGLILRIENGIIAAVEPAAGLSQFNDYRIIDLKGKTVLPGLIDNHVHITVPFMFDVNLNAVKQMNRQIVNNFRACVMSGVTTVRDMGGFPGKINTFRALSDAGVIPGPRIISSLSPIAARKGNDLGAPEKAPYFSNPVITWLLGGNYAERPRNTDEIRDACGRMISLGAQWLKTLHQDHSYSYHPRALPNHTDEGYRAILEIGKKYNLRCALHEPLLSGFMKGVDLGFHTLEHMPLDSLIPERYMEKFIRQDMAMMPTLVAYGDASNEEDILHLVETRGGEFLVPEAARQVAALLKESIQQGKRKMSDAERRALKFDRRYLIDAYPTMVRNAGRLHKMGAVMGAGTDLGGYYSGFFGRFADELRRYRAAGIPAPDVLRMATSVNAKIIGMEGKTGVIKKGAQADLIVVEGDPLKDLGALDTVRLVMKGGVFMKGDA